MQLYALDNQTPMIASRAEKGKSYQCPECKGEVRLRSGPARQAHFYHHSSTPHCNQHKKSLEHLQTQLMLQDLIGIDTLSLESPFPSINRIADAVWHVHKIVFEVQCSPMPLEEAVARVKDYTSTGYTPIWILHDKRFNTRHVSATENYLRSIPCYFTNIDKEGKGVIYDQFELIHAGRRLFKGPTLALDMKHLLLLPKTAPPDIPMPQALLTRLAHWSHFTRGDLLDRFLKEKKSALSAKRMLALEHKLLATQKTSKRLPLPQVVRTLYNHLLKRWLVLHTKNS